MGKCPPYFRYFTTFQVEMLSRPVQIPKVRWTRRLSTDDGEVRYTHVVSQRWDPLLFIGIGIATYFFMFEPREHTQETGRDKWTVMARRAWNRYTSGESARLEEMEKSLEPVPLPVLEKPIVRKVVPPEQVDMQVEEIMQLLAKESRKP